VQRSDDEGAADVFDFIDEFLSDVEHRRELPLAHYLARYPRNQERVAREYLELRAPDGSQAAFGEHDSPAHADRDPGRDGARRIGPYRCVREIGRGGQGAVFLAEDTRIARRVALKVLAARFDGVSEERLKRFRREAEVVARLEHPNICSIYDADLDGDTPWIAMRFVEGRTLAEILSSARRSAASSSADPADALNATRTPATDATNSTWPPRSAIDVHRVLHLFERCARALHAAHEAGVVHRDVKPGNIVVAHDGAPVLLDFGLARDEQSDVGELTQAGDVFGTPAYMSP